MPCPYFEPQRAVVNSEHPGARLPLIQEYEGVCHAGSEPFQAPSALRFRCCNHGYSLGVCDHFPGSENRSALRYQLNRLSAAELEITVIEEQDYAPAAWRVVKYSTEHQQLEPEIQDCCIRAQIVALCRAYLSRFAS